MAADNKSKGTKKDKPQSKPKGKAVGTRKKTSDPRFRIISGVFLMLVSLFLFVSTIGYIINYNLTGNWGNTIGMWLSRDSFGIGSFYLVFLLFISGSLLTFKGPKIRIITICKYCLVFLVWLPLLLATIMLNNNCLLCEKFYGNVGTGLNELLNPYISNIGIYIVLFFTAFLYVIFTFDIKMPTFNFKKDNIENDGEDDIDDNGEDNGNDDTEEKPLPLLPIKKDGEEIKIEIGDDTVTEVVDEEIDESEDETEDEEDEDVEITVKHISHETEKNPLVIDLDPVTETEDVEDKDDELIETIEIEIQKPKEENPEIKVPGMEVTIPTEEKQAEKIGEHFGLDTDFDPKLELSNYKFPPLDLLKDYGESSTNVDREELEANKKRIVDTLANYNIAIDKIKATIGPTVTLYEIVPAAGVRISKIKGLQDDIALCLSAIGIRIIAPIPGKGTVGIEVPNQKPQIVSMRSVLGSERFQKCGYELPFGIGKTISNESYVADLAKMPHILMAGATGQGKSVGINAIISSLLYSKHPAELKFVLVDPKKVELSLYKKIERHFLAKLPDAEEAIITDVRKVVRTLNSLCIEMDNRYELLKDAQVRNIKEYNAKFIARKLNPYEGHRFLPYIVLVVDEFADLIMTAGKEVEAPIARLAQLARAIGIHLIIATQRPSVNIITGTIKANFPARIAFRVISRVDSGTILDTNGADQLIGRGDMLLSTGNDLVRLQCAFIDTPEVEEITDFIGNQRAYPDAYNLPDCPDEKDDGGSKENLNPDERDPLFEEAAYIIVQTQQGSTSMLQRKLKLGYNRAGRIIDQLEKAGIVGPFAGSKQREVKIANEMALEQYLKDLYMDDDSEL